jgi:hypothetical protein
MVMICFKEPPKHMFREVKEKPYKRSQLKRAALEADNWTLNLSSIEHQF